MATAKKSPPVAGKKAPSTEKAPASKTSTAAKSPAKKTTTASKTDATAKAPAKKSSANKVAARKSPASGGRKYSPGASKDVEREMRAMKEGKLTIGKSKQKVTNPKQAIAIGLAEARREGKKVPPNPNETE